MDHMLSVTQVRNPREKRELFLQMSDFSWVVADVRTRELLQRARLTSQTVSGPSSRGISGFALLRASELWKFYFENRVPELAVVSSDFGELFLNDLLFSNAFRETSESLGISSRSILNLWNFYSEVLIERGAAEKFLQFLVDEKLESKLRVSFEFAYTLLQHFMGEGWILGSLVPSVLADRMRASDQKLPPEITKIVFDLGPSVQSCEIDLMLELAKTLDVHVLAPAREMMENSLGLKVLYERVLSHGPAQPHGGDSFTDVVTQKFPHPISELRGALATARRWINQDGIRPDQIVIAKNKFTKTELEIVRQSGLQIHRLNLESPISQGELSYQKTQSQIRVRWGSDARFGDYEMLEADRLGEINEFRAASRVHIQAQMRSQLRNQKNGAAETITVFDYLKNEMPGFEVAGRMREEIIQLPLSFRAKPESWRTWFDAQAAKLESLRLGEMDPSSVYLENWRTVGDLGITHRIILGLDLKSVRPRSSFQFLNRSEALRFFYKSGIYIGADEGVENEFDLQWLLSEKTETTILSFSEVDFLGTQNAPHALWVRAAVAEGGDHRPEVARPSSAEAGPSPPVKLLRERRKISRAVGEISPASLSASNIGRFVDCSAIYLYEKVFGLRDYDEADEFGSHRSRGTFYHRLFERASAVEENIDLEAFVEETTKEFIPFLFHPEVWPFEKRKAIRTLESYFAIEKSLREIYPEFRVESVEGEFAFDRVLDGVPTYFRGRFDRIENWGNGERALIDFKATAQFPSPAKWIEKNKLQFLFYMWVLKNDPTRETPVDFHKIVEWSYKTMERREFDAAEIETFLPEFEKLLETIVRKIHAGAFEAMPRNDDLSFCSACRWFQICRNPQLLQY